ncbi:MAG: PilZ domain-containing protein [Clostridia bacterium]|nr:PilZ domain-containing protein [Clostridia bacterium]
MVTYKSIRQLQRRHHRISVHFPVEFRVVKFGEQDINHLEGKKGLGRTQDIGENGLSFISPLNLPLNMMLRLKFVLPTGHQYWELVKVVRSRPCGNKFLTGVEFINFSGPRRERLSLFIASEVKRNVKLLEYI